MQLHEIGRGREATVYIVATNGTAGKYGALRVPRVHPRMSRFTLLLCAMPQHAHLVQIHEADTATGRLLLEYVGGGTLSDELTCSVVSPLRAASVVAQVLRGLAHLHAHGFMHGDVSPRNVLLSNGACECKLTDYFAESPCCGAPAYMAPEAARDEAVQASDMWSVGCLMLELTGMSPWQQPEVRLEDGTVVELSCSSALLYHLACRAIAMRGPPEFAECADPCGLQFFDSLASVFQPPDRRKRADELLLGCARMC